MSALPLKVSCNERRSIICIQLAKGHSANASQSEMRPVYGIECYTRPAIHVFGVKSLLMVTKVLLMSKYLVAVLFRRPMQRSQLSIPS